MARLVLNDFRYGMIDEDFSYRNDTTIYAMSAKLIENCIVRKAGGLRQRGGFHKVLSASGARRTIPFVIDEDNVFLLVLSNLKLDIYRQNSDKSLTLISSPSFSTKITDAMIDKIQYAQNAEMCVIVNKDIPPCIVKYLNDGGDVSFSVSDIVLDVTTDRVDTQVKDGEEIEVPFQFDYEGLFTKNNFPSCVTFANSRLWFASSKEKPYTLWVSKPFEYTNFQDFEYYKIEDETVTTEQYLKAMENYTDKVTDNGDGTETRVKKQVSADGYVVITTGVYNKETGDLIGELKTETFNYTTPAISWEEITTQSSAMVLDMANVRNERINWIANIGDYIIVGTTSGEHYIPASCDATTVYKKHLSNYGSAYNVQSAIGDRNIFYLQVGGKRLRTIAVADGVSFADMTYANEEIIKKGVKEILWQRVPYQTLYCVLKDGTLAVLFYDIDYQIQAWTLWEVKGQKVVSAAILSNEDGEDIYFLLQDGSVCYIDTDIHYDITEENPIESKIISNCIDSTETFALNKKLYSVTVCSKNTEFEVRQVGLETFMKPRDYYKKFIDVNINNIPTNEEMRIEIRSIPLKPFEIKCLIAKVEVTE